MLLYSSDDYGFLVKISQLVFWIEHVFPFVVDDKTGQCKGRYVAVADKGWV